MDAQTTLLIALHRVELQVAACLVEVPVRLAAAMLSVALHLAEVQVAVRLVEVRLAAKTTLLAALHLVAGLPHLGKV